MSLSTFLLMLPIGTLLSAVRQNLLIPKSVFAVPKVYPGNQEKDCSFIFSIRSFPVFVNMSTHVHFAQIFLFKLYVFMKYIFQNC